MIRCDIRSVWPPLAVLALALVLCLQIPHKALFFKPAREAPADRFASIVSFTDSAYRTLIHHVRTSWPVRSSYTQDDSRMDAFKLSDEAQPLPSLEIPQSFFVRASSSTPIPYVQPLLLPPTLAASEPMPSDKTQPTDDSSAREIRRELLAQPASLGDGSAYLPPLLDTPFKTEQQPQ